MTPLLIGQTVTPSLLATVLFPLLGMLVLGAWATLDAKARGSAHPVAWGVAVAVLPLLVVVYVLSRGERTHAPTDRERAALTVLLAVLVGLMIGSVFSPPDVYADPRPTFGGFLFSIPLFYLLVYRDDRDSEDEDVPEDGEGGEHEDSEGGDGDNGGDSENEPAE